VSRFCLAHKSSPALTHDLGQSFVREDATTADLLAHIAEFDARKLYLPAGYETMRDYCVLALLRSEDAAYKRIQAARAAREFPALFEAVADGQLSLSGVCLLAPHLTPANAEGLLAGARGKSKADIARLIAERFPRTETLPLVQRIPARPLSAHRERSATSPLAPGQVNVNVPPTRVAPIATERYHLQLTIAQQTLDKLRHAQELLSHAVPSGDIAAVMDRALDALLAKLEKGKFAATDRPRRSRVSNNARYVPATVKRQVWERDRGQCTFVGDSGHRCGSRTRLEFDHAHAVAQGGQTSVDNVRLRCRAHNQFTAEETFGAAFMERKRRAASEKRVRRNETDDRDVVPWLRALGVRADDARKAAERCASIPDAPLEERVRRALTFCGPRGTTYHPAPSVAAP